MRFFLIQGIFFQCRETTKWGGILLQKTEDGPLEGNLEDRYGESDVTDVQLDEEKGTLSFTKRYCHRTDTIRYTFTRGEDGSWEGRYDGSATGTDGARCVLAPVTMAFFKPPVLHPASAN